MDELIDVKMPPEPEPAPPPLKEKEVFIDETKNTIKQVIDEVKQEESSDEERETIPDEEVFKQAPKVAKVKRKASEKQLAHLARMREKKAEKDREKREWLDEQKRRQKKYVKAEKKKDKKKPKRPPTPSSSEEEEESSEEEEVVRKHRQETPHIFHKLTAGEIRQIQRDAIMDYDALRKQRKQKKQIYEQQVEEERTMRSNMAKMSQPDNDPWSSAFNFQ